LPCPLKENIPRLDGEIQADFTCRENVLEALLKAQPLVLFIGPQKIIGSPPEAGKHTVFKQTSP